VAAGIFRSVQVSTWVDQKFQSLGAPGPSGQFLWLFLITGKYSCNIPGVVRQSLTEWLLACPPRSFSDTIEVDALRPALIRSTADSCTSAKDAFTCWWPG
jgi:hypothetical protein